MFINVGSLRFIMHLSSLFSVLLFVAGIFFVALGIFVDVKLFGAVFAQDKSIDNIFVLNNFWVARLIFFSIGIPLIMNKLYISTVVKHQKQFMLLAAVFLMCVLFLEISSFFIIKNNFSHWVLGGKTLSYQNLEFNVTGVFNSLGFRDEEFDNLTEYRIAIVGDSFVLGDGVNRNETFEYLLENELDISVLNLGYSGGSPSDYLQILSEMLPTIKPNLTIISLYLENDISCKKNAFSFFNNLRFMLRKILTEYDYRNNNLMDESILSEEYKNYALQGLINPSLVINAHYNPNVSQNYAQIIDWWKNCDYTRNVLLKIRTVIDRSNSKMIILLIPPKYQALPQPGLEKLGYHVASSLLENRDLQDDILEFCAEQKMLCVDLLPELINSTLNPYFNVDIHFNSHGHEIASEVLLKYMENNVYKPISNITK